MGTLSSAINASASALSVERTRIEAAVSNLANAESTRSQNGQPYRRRDVILQAEPAAGSFSAAMASSGATGVRVARVVEDQSEFRRRYEPGHPDADAGRLRVAAERRRPHGDGGHAGRAARYAGQPRRHRHHS